MLHGMRRRDRALEKGGGGLWLLRHRTWEGVHEGSVLGRVMGGRTAYAIIGCLWSGGWGVGESMIKVRQWGYSCIA